MHGQRHWNLRCWMLLLVAAIALSGCAAGGRGDEFDISAVMKQGQALYAAKKYDEAIARFREVVGKDANYWTAYLWIARSFIAKGSWQEAIDNGRKAFELSPKGQDTLGVFAEALFGGGADALRNGRLNEAVRHFLDYLKLDPGNVRAWLNVGRAYLGQDQYRDALNSFIQGLAKGGGADRAELLRGLFDSGTQAFARGNFRDAIDSLREYVKADNGNLTAYVNLAKAYWESGERGNALDAFRRVLQLNPRHEEALRFVFGK